MTSWMQHDTPVTRNAAALEQRVMTAQQQAREAGDDVDHADALAEMLHYAELLREAGLGTQTRYSFKRELADGRWDVTEQPLPAGPQVGDIVNFEDGGLWRIVSTQWVQPRPQRKPPRAFFVCAPAT